MDSNTEEDTVKIEQINVEDYGKCIRETWTNKDGLIHRDNDRPAVILREDKNKEPFQKEWCQNGMLDRKGAPARIYNNGSVKTEEWFEKVLAHRNNGPTVIEVIPNGIVIKETWIKHGIEHREDDPSHIIRDGETKVIVSENWRINNKLHRKDGPASIERHEQTGIATSETWFFNGEAHRQDGPAVIKRDWRSGEVTKIEYCENGVRLNITTPNMEPVM